MSANEGNWDRVIRVVLGIIVMWWGYTMIASWAGWVVLLIGLYWLVTGLVGSSPVYSWAKWDTSKHA